MASRAARGPDICSSAVLIPVSPRLKSAAMAAAVPAASAAAAAAAAAVAIAAVIAVVRGFRTNRRIYDIPRTW